MILSPEVVASRVGEAMNFLNEAAERFPNAISLAAGRPYPAVIELKEVDRALDQFVACYPHLEKRIYQYGATPGFIGEVLSRAIATDEGIHLPPSSICTTLGAQEAMLLLLLSQFQRGRDVLLVPDPTYVGITGAAALAGIELACFSAEGVSIEELEEIRNELRSKGKRLKGMYMVPDASNPLGTTLSLEERQNLVTWAKQSDVLLLEDSPYRYFVFEKRQPTLLALNSSGGVVQIGSMAKTISPSLRMGYVAWPNAPESAWKALLQAKSFASLNTPGLTQATTAGILLKEGAEPSFNRIAAKARQHYRHSRNRLLAQLEESFGKTQGVTWNTPEGGFFLTLQLPFVFGEAEMKKCAEQYGVLVCPVSLFSLGQNWNKAVRLSYSSLSEEEMVEGVKRLANYINREIACPENKE